MSADHVMVVPDCDPVRIGAGPTVATRFEDLCTMRFLEVWVDGRRFTMSTPWPDPQPVPNSPYEAYVLGDWVTDRFAIRLREDHDPQEER